MTKRHRRPSIKARKGDAGGPGYEIGYAKPPRTPASSPARAAIPRATAEAAGA